MKVTVDIDNVIILDGNDVAEIAAFVKALRNGSAPAPASAPAKPGKKRGPYKKKAKPVEEVELSAQTYETWQWLVANDDPNGVKVNAIADGLGITVHAATFRCNKLIEKGLAYRVRRGRYRPGEVPDEVPGPAAPEQPVAASESDAEPQ